jgi:hypothetical protein
MNVFEKIKLWFTSISKIVKFLTDTFGEAKILKDKQANFKDWVEFVIAFIKDALQYADEIAALSQAQPVQTKGQVIKAVKENKSLSANFQTAFFREKAQNFNK